MALRIGTNVPSLVAQRNLSRVTEQIGHSFARLATGRRIVTAADDPAGAAIAARLEAQIRGLQQADRNALDGVSLLQVGEAGLSDIGDALNRARELAVNAANGTLTTPDRVNLQHELDEILRSVDSVARTTSFNGISILAGPGQVAVQVGPNATAFDVNYVSTIDATANGLGISGLDITSESNARNALTTLDLAIDRVSSNRSQFGASMNGLQTLAASDEHQVEALEAAHSRIMDVDIAAETAELARLQVLQQAALSVLAQANQQPALALQLLRSLG